MTNHVIVTSGESVAPPPSVLTYQRGDTLLLHVAKPYTYGADTTEPSPVCATWADPTGASQRCTCGAIEWLPTYAIVTLAWPWPSPRASHPHCRGGVCVTDRRAATAQIIIGDSTYIPCTCGSVRYLIRQQQRDDSGRANV